MVHLMMAGLGGDRRHPNRPPPDNLPADLPKNGSSHGIECYHVNVRLSKELEDIGDLRVGKFMLLLGYCAQAIWCRFRYGVTNFYYVPAPGKRSALYRDWVVMLLCRPFFKKVILHWHASGLAKWLETVVQIRSRSITYQLARQADLSIVLSDYGRADAEKFFPRGVAVVGNGIPDPCPNFAASLLRLRRARVEARQRLIAGQPVSADLRAACGRDPAEFRVLFLAHCTEDKGLFEAVRGAILAHQQLAASGSPLRLKLQVAGQFVHEEEEEEFHRLRGEAGAEVVEYKGFVAGAQKRRLYEEADVFCFPSHIESFGLVLVEAMAFGLPIVTTRCGALPEVMPASYPGLVEARAPAQVAQALLASITEASFETLRERFQQNYTLEKHLHNLAAAIRSAEAPHPVPAEGQVPEPVRYGA